MLILVPLPVSACSLPAQKFAYYVSSMFADILCKYGKVASSCKVVSSHVSVLFTSWHKLFIDKGSYIQAENDILWKIMA